MKSATNSYREFLEVAPVTKAAAPLEWLYELRRASHEKFKNKGFPTKKAESWKYLDLEPLLGASFVEPGDKAAEYCCPAEVVPYFLRDEEEHRLVFVNGVYSAKLSSPGVLSHGIFLESLAENLALLPDFLETHLGSLTRDAENAFTLVNNFSFKDGAVFVIPKNTQMETPVHLVFVASGDSRENFASYPRIFIALGEGAKANVVVNFIGDSHEAYFSNAVTEISLGEGASLDYTYIHRGAEKGFEFLNNYYTLAKSSELRVLSFATGGKVTRNENRVELKGEHASASLKGLSVLGGESQVFHHATVNHSVPHCTSRQVYKNILTGKAKTEFNSLVYVHRDAIKSDSHQLNRNLLLSDQAESFSRPQLRIDTDDVSCTHGATMGQLEKTELFYLRSRGLSEEQARFLLTYGFAEELVEEVKPLSLREQLETLVQKCLEKVVFKDLGKI